jgi:hypothetical protein
VYPGPGIDAMYQRKQKVLGTEGFRSLYWSWPVSEEIPGIDVESMFTVFILAKQFFSFWGCQKPG